MLKKWLNFHKFHYSTIFAEKKNFSTEASKEKRLVATKECINFEKYITRESSPI